MSQRVPYTLSFLLGVYTLVALAVNWLCCGACISSNSAKFCIRATKVTTKGTLYSHPGHTPELNLGQGLTCIPCISCIPLLYTNSAVFDKYNTFELTTFYKSSFNIKLCCQLSSIILTESLFYSLSN